MLVLHLHMYLTVPLIINIFNNIIFLHFVALLSKVTHVQALDFTHDRQALNNAGLLHGVDMQYFGQVGFGTPPQTFNLMFDTSSSGIEVPGIMCVIPCMTQRQFDYTASSTFENSQEKSTIRFYAGGPMTFQFMDVLQASDTMVFLGRRYPRTPFNMITNQTSGFFSNPYDGILGLNLDPSSAVYKAIREMGYSAMFGLYLTPSRIGGSEFSVGGIDESKLNGTKLIWVPAVKSNTTNKRWTLVASKIYVNDVEMDPNLFQNQQFVFHTGESSIVVGRQLATAMYSTISPKIVPIGTDGNYGIPCNEMPSLEAVITFTFSSTHRSPFNLTLPSRDLNTGGFVDNPSICQTVINAADIQGGIIGVSLLKHYYTVWDVDNARIGFASNGY